MQVYGYGNVDNFFINANSQIIHILKPACHADLAARTSKPAAGT
jgi:hypothetical protein